MSAPTLPFDRVNATTQGEKDIVRWQRNTINQLMILLSEMTTLLNALAEGQLDQVELTVTHSPPPSPAEGWIVYADGTDWNPGAGRGTYEYVSGVWVKL